MTAVIVGVDPGLSKGSAVAVLDAASGRVIAARIVKAPGARGPVTPWTWLAQPADLAAIVGSEIVAKTWVRSGWPTTEHVEQPRSIALLVAELPQVYDRRNTAGKKPDPADLIDLAALSGAWCEAGRALGARAELIRPAAWKGGNTPKEIEAERTRAALSPAEIKLVQDAAPRGRWGDLWDAVGIARWAWRRARRPLDVTVPEGWFTTPDGPHDP